MPLEAPGGKMNPHRKVTPLWRHVYRIYHISTIRRHLLRPNRCRCRRIRRLPAQPSPPARRKAFTIPSENLDMSKLRISAFGLSIDGYGAGPNQSLENPLGVGGMALHEWALSTRTFQKMFGNEGGATGVDDDFAISSFATVGS